METERTHVSPPVLPTVGNPDPPPPHMERDRQCLWCGAIFGTTEKVVSIEKPGDPERVAVALAAAADEKVRAPEPVRLLLTGDRANIDVAHEMMRSGSVSRRDDGQMLLEFELLEET